MKWLHHKHIKINITSAQLETTLLNNIDSDNIKQKQTHPSTSESNKKETITSANSKDMSSNSGEPFFVAFGSIHAQTKENEYEIH